MVPKMWDKPLWEGVCPHLDPSDNVRLRTASTHCDVPKKYGPHGGLLFFLIEKAQVVASDEVLPNPYVSAEALEACALIGLHLLAADYEVGSSGSQSPDPGDLWKHGVQNARFGAARVPQVSPLVTKRSMGTTTSAGPLQSLGRIGQVKWKRSFKRIGSWGEWR